MPDVGNFLAALSRDTLADVIRDLQQAVADGNDDLRLILDQTIAMLTDKNE
jgi:hypothetical protein